MNRPNPNGEPQPPSRPDPVRVLRGRKASRGPACRAPARGRGGREARRDAPGEGQGNGDRTAPAAGGQRKHGHFFDRFARTVTRWTGSPIAFGLALAAIVVWCVTGPVFGYSETWQLVVNTGTTIITFLMVFLIQQSQNKDSQAVHLKLDELLLALRGADDSLVDAEDLDEDELRRLASHYEQMSRHVQGRLARLGGEPERGAD
ncbi:low affinity iron permease family protein [Bordetella genomosp. 1]|uniref:Low affinity iron permease family protein n=1 Tax=Bordetella genomosp. 1 TaxID=1395607 RepID=A0ABX4F4G9_9BORD|nr:low affinity iron permease family protein [Bordetella genomosp. 1]OZI65974.1 hypothetical protein CAL27_13390 [Bordetella genomosp. 1]